MRQLDGKLRLIDDGLRGGQNLWSTEEETIYTISLDIIVEMVTVVSHLVVQLWSDQPEEAGLAAILAALSDWFETGHGTVDLPDAFRGALLACLTVKLQLPLFPPR